MSQHTPGQEAADRLLIVLQPYVLALADAQIASRERGYVNEADEVAIYRTRQTALLTIGADLDALDHIEFGDRPAQFGVDDLGQGGTDGLLEFVAHRCRV